MGSWGGSPYRHDAPGGRGVVARCLGWRAMKKLLIVALLVALGVGFVAARRLRDA
jgi:hypothetical protein